MEKGQWSLLCLVNGSSVGSVASRPHFCSLVWVCVWAVFTTAKTLRNTFLYSSTFWVFWLSFPSHLKINTTPAHHKVSHVSLLNTPDSCSYTYILSVHMHTYLCSHTHSSFTDIYFSAHTYVLSFHNKNRECVCVRSIWTWMCLFVRPRMDYVSVVSRVLFWHHYTILKTYSSFQQVPRTLTVGLWPCALYITGS